MRQEVFEFAAHERDLSEGIDLQVAPGPAAVQRQLELTGTSEMFRVVGSADAAPVMGGSPLESTE